MKLQHARAATLALCLGLVTGCFTVQHELPENAYFGRLPSGSGEVRQPFQVEAMKNWWLSGLAPYSAFDTAELLEPLDATRLEELQVETIFSELDTLVWIVPGFLYGYYIWAPRTLSVTGTEVRSSSSDR